MLIHQLQDKVEMLSVKIQPAGSLAASRQSSSLPPITEPAVHPSGRNKSDSQPSVSTDSQSTNEQARLIYAERARAPATITRTSPAPMKKIALITDSIAKDIHHEALEKITGAKITKAKAYAATKKPRAEGYRFADKNFTDVVPAVISKNDHQTALLLASSVHLTNLPKNTSHEQASEQAREASHQIFKGGSRCCEEPH